MDIRAVAMGLAFVVIWSSAFTSARIIVSDAPAMLALSVRFFIAGIIGVGLARVMGQNWSFRRDQWKSIVVFGLCQNGVYLGFFFVAMQTVEASLASIIASSMPLVVGAISTLFLRQTLKPAAVFGLSLGFAGVLVIMSMRLTAGSDLGGIVLCVVGTIALAVATLAVRGANAGDRVLMIVGIQSFIGAAPLFIASVAIETWQVNWTPALGGAMAYTIVLPGLTATWIWFKLVERVGTVKASAYHFLNPFFGVAIAAVFLAETVTVWDFIGVVTIMIGILIVQLSKS